MKKELIERVIFADGDYVRHTCGDIFLCAGMQGDKYLFHAALERENGAIRYPDSEFHLYCCIVPDDRLCTCDEMNCINERLMWEGKTFDPTERKLVDSALKKNRGLSKKFIKEFEKYKRNDKTMEGTTILYCELMTSEQVSEFDSLMARYGYDKMRRPMVYANRLPVWAVEKRERKADEDPLAVITLIIDHDTEKVMFDAGYRSCSGRLISPEQMKNLFLAHHYEGCVMEQKDK